VFTDYTAGRLDHGDDCLPRRVDGGVDMTWLSRMLVFVWNVNIGGRAPFASPTAINRVFLSPSFAFYPVYLHLSV